MGFIVGGVQKAGTTSLFGYLSLHPQMVIPSTKEAHFFDDETQNWAEPDYSKLRRLFPEGIGTGIGFDVTPIYLFWPPALERIRRYNPRIKLIFVFRDPIERAWSQWRMETDRQAESLPFHVAIRQGRWRLRSVVQTDPAWRVYSYVERGFYARQLRRLFALFPRENVLLLRSLDLQNDHRGTLESIARFLSIQSFPPLAPRKDHTGKTRENELRPEDVTYLREVFYDDTVEFSRLSGLSVADWPTVDPNVAIAG
ncbi:sulfotransferase [Mesorhizobium sp. LCM 4577]|uniref:sulfotransferase family protein n=1 Tax=Mesorhizobium sp. LCM 4577 TaxID=1848288 RepID=UPI00352A0381